MKLTAWITVLSLILVTILATIDHVYHLYSHNLEMQKQLWKDQMSYNDDVLKLLSERIITEESRLKCRFIVWSGKKSVVCELPK